jgi:hypothetical protein
MIKDQLVTNCAFTTHSIKLGKLTVNVKNCFYPEKDLFNILFSIASNRLKEKSA